MSRDEINKLIWGLPLSERCALLACSIVEANPGAIAPMHGMIRVVTEMARSLSVERRIQLAERLRDVADEIEQPHKVRVEIK